MTPDSTFARGASVPDGRRVGTHYFDSGVLDKGEDNYVGIGMPRDGSTVYVQLGYRTAEGWFWITYPYQATKR
ncbi:MAG: hypothetical protein R2748_25875 [Bryobacterales bacterium]